MLNQMLDGFNCFHLDTITFEDQVDVVDRCIGLFRTRRPHYASRLSCECSTNASYPFAHTHSPYPYLESMLAAGIDRLCPQNMID